MVIVTTQARRFAERVAEGTGRTKATFFGGRSSSGARLARWDLPSGERTGSTYLWYVLLVLGGVAAGILLGRQSKRGDAPPSSSSHAGGTGADAPDQVTPDPAGVPGSTSGPPQRPADDRGGGPARRQPGPQDVAPPAPPSFAEPPRPEDLTSRPVEDLDRAPAEGVPSHRSSGTSPGEGASIAEESPPKAADAELPPSPTPPIPEKQNAGEQLPPPPRASGAELPPPPQASNVELPPPPPSPEVAEDLPPPPPTEEAPGIEELPPEVTEVDLPPPPQAPQNVVDELPPPPVPEEQDVGDIPAAPEPPAEPAGEAPRTEDTRLRHVTATAAARRRAEELGVDLLEVEGTGADGRITVEDVRRAGEQTRS